MDGDEVISIPAPGGLGRVLVVGIAWATAMRIASYDEVFPPWALLAVLAAAPVVGVAAIWTLLNKPVVVASADGVRLTRRYASLWDTFVHRSEIAMILLDQPGVRWEDPTEPGAGRGRSPYAVVARTADGHEVTLASGFVRVEDAKEVADRIRRVVGCGGGEPHARVGAPGGRAVG